MNSTLGFYKYYYENSLNKGFFHGKELIDWKEVLNVYNFEIFENDSNSNVDFISQDIVYFYCSVFALIEYLGLSFYFHLIMNKSSNVIYIQYKYQISSDVKVYNLLFFN